MFGEVKSIALELLDKERFSNLARYDSEKQEHLLAVIDKYAQTHPQSVPKLKSLGFLSANAT